MSEAAVSPNQITLLCAASVRARVENNHSSIAQWHTENLIIFKSEGRLCWGETLDTEIESHPL